MDAKEDVMEDAKEVTVASSVLDHIHTQNVLTGRMVPGQETSNHY